MNYNVGDTVYIKSLNWYNNEYVEPRFEAIFTYGMSKYCGKKATIIAKNEGSYFIDIDMRNDNGWAWCDYMFSLKTERLKKLKKIMK